MKKISALFIALALLFALASCADGEKNTENNPSSVKTESVAVSSDVQSQAEITVNVSQIKEKVHNKVAEITDPSMSKLEKAEYIYEWIFWHFKYRAEAVDLSNGFTDELTASLVDSFFKYQKGSCEHYAAVEKMFFEELGYECMYVEGDRYDSGNDSWGDHVWIMVKTDGNYYHVDGLFGGNHTSNLKSMFMVPDSALAETHKWDTNKYPACTSNQLLPTIAD